MKYRLNWSAFDEVTGINTVAAQRNVSSGWCVNILHCVSKNAHLFHMTVVSTNVDDVYSIISGTQYMS